MSEHRASVNTQELFYCEQHGMFEPGRFDVDWNTDYGCPVHSEFGDRCDQTLVSVDLSPALGPPGTDFTQPRVPLSEVREALEKLERFEPEHDESSRQEFALGNDPIVMESDEEGDWLRRSDVLAAFPSTDSEGQG